MAIVLILACLLTVTIYSMEQEEIELSQAHSKAVAEKNSKKDLDIIALLSTKIIYYSTPAFSHDKSLFCTVQIFQPVHLEYLIGRGPIRKKLVVFEFDTQKNIWNLKQEFPLDRFYSYSKLEFVNETTIQLIKQKNNFQQPNSQEVKVFTLTEK